MQAQSQSLLAQGTRCRCCPLKAAIKIHSHFGGHLSKKRGVFQPRKLALGEDLKGFMLRERSWLAIFPKQLRSHRGWCCRLCTSRVKPQRHRGHRSGGPREKQRLAVRLEAEVGERDCATGRRARGSVTSLPVPAGRGWLHSHPKLQLGHLPRKHSTDLGSQVSPEDRINRTERDRGGGGEGERERA